MYNRLIDFPKKNNVLYSGQFGFRANHSTTHVIFQITDKIQNPIENKVFSCGIFLDLTKAFDTVDHNILIRKLEYYGIRGLSGDWFRWYLTNRYQMNLFQLKILTHNRSLSLVVYQKDRFWDHCYFCCT